MWPWILGSAGLGSVLGGIQGYQQGKGDLGAALRGAAAGGLAGAATGGIGGLASGAVSRMAGTALGGALEASPILGGLQKAAGTGAGLLAGGLAAPVVGPIAGGLTNLAGQAVGGAGRAVAAAGGGAAAMGVGQQPLPKDYDFSQGVPTVTGQVPYLGGTPFDIYNPLGPFAAMRAEALKDQDVSIEGLKKFLPLEAQYSEGAKKAEFQRQMAAAGIRSNIATQAAMLRQAQLGAQQMGQTALGQMGQALTSQYQYG